MKFGTYDRYISIHALREEGDAGVQLGFLFIDISIHALREEGDPLLLCVNRRAERFLSTPSARRATGICARYELQYIISIHALREEGDRHRRPSRLGEPQISIHALREEGDFSGMVLY